MATIDFNDANNDGVGINFLSYLSNWDTNFTPGYGVVCGRGQNPTLR